MKAEILIPVTAARRRVLTVPETCSIGLSPGWARGNLCLLALLLLSEPIPVQIGFLIQMNIATFATLCVASVAMCVVAVVLRRRVPRGRQHYAR